MRNNRSWFIQASINPVTRTSALVIFDEEMVMEERDGGGVLLLERFHSVESSSLHFDLEKWSSIINTYNEYTF